MADLGLFVFGMFMFGMTLLGALLSGYAWFARAYTRHEAAHPPPRRTAPSRARARRSGAL